MIQKINVQILLFGFLSTINGFDLQCPHPSQRTFRIQSVCNGNASAYTCLYDTKKKGYVEFCANRKDNYVRAGLKYVISGTFRNVRCSDGRYQPVRFWSNQSSVCMNFKSECNYFGEIVYNNRSSIYDATCRCDYTRGYAFVSKPRNKCFCIPSEEDCSCYIKQCPTNTTLSPDNECIYVGLANENFYCHPVIKRQKHGNETDTAVSFEDNEQLKSWNHSVRIGLASVILGSSAILVILVVMHVIYKTRPIDIFDDINTINSDGNSDATGKNKDSPDLYDLENASSIALSDIDVSYYYGASRHGQGQWYRDNYNKQLSKTNGHGPPSHHWNSNGSRESPDAFRMQTSAMLKRNSPELYDLEDPSSIASSDIDVSYYYGASRHGQGQWYRDNYNKQLSKTNGHGPPSHHWNSNGSRESPDAFSMQTSAMLKRNSPELYDLEDASSIVSSNASKIAPSDIDVSYYYGASRHGQGQWYRDNYKKQLSKTNGHGPPSHHWNYNGSRESPGALRMQTTTRQNRNSPELYDLEDSSSTASSNTSSIAPSDIDVSYYYGASRHGKGQLYIDNYKKQISNTNLHDQPSHHGRRYYDDSVVSHHSPHSISPTSSAYRMPPLPNGHIKHSTGKRPMPGSRVPNHSRPVKVLTVEEVDKLNARPSRPSPVSMLEAVSSSTEENRHNQQFEPLDINWDERSNDSFTCSEFDYVRDKGHSDFDPSAMNFSKDAEVDNKKEDFDVNPNYRNNDGLASYGSSFASFEGGRRNGAPVNGAINLDYFTDWGPYFEVFKDIASLSNGDRTLLINMDCMTETFV